MTSLAQKFSAVAIAITAISLATNVATASIGTPKAGEFNPKPKTPPQQHATYTVLNATPKFLKDTCRTGANLYYAGAIDTYKTDPKTGKSRDIKGPGLLECNQKTIKVLEENHCGMIANLTQPRLTTIWNLNQKASQNNLSKEDKINLTINGIELLNLIKASTEHCPENTHQPQN